MVFIREIVPKRAVTWLARLAYGENYVRYPMRHRVSAHGAGAAAEYEWRMGRNWARLHAEAAGEPEVPAEGSIEQVISEHYWGYSALPGSTISRAPLAEASGALSIRRPGSPPDPPGSTDRRPRSPSLQRDGGTVEYHVTHPQSRVWRGASGGFEGDGAALYGDAFGGVLRRAPDSAFIADGSAVEVIQGRRVA